MTDSSDSFLPCGFEKRTMRALRAFGDREGHVDVPDGHIEHVDDVAVSLGAWVGEMHVAYSRDELAPEQVAVLKAVPGWLWAFPPLSLDFDTADEADLARWFKNDTDFRLWLDGRAAWLARDTSDTAVENTETAVTDEAGLADELDILIERPAKEEPDPDEEDLADWLAGRSDKSGDRSLDYLFSEHHGSDTEAPAMLAELVKFVEREGHADVPFDYWFVDAAGVERPLDSWVHEVRRAFRHDTLSADLIAALDGVDGWVWPPKLDRWCKVLDDFRKADERSFGVLQMLSPLYLTTETERAPTLESVGKRIDRTRERVRQIRDEAAKDLYGNPVVAEAADKLAGLLDPAIPYGVLPEVFVADEPHLEVLAAVVVYAGPLQTSGKQAVWGATMRGDSGERPLTWYGTGIRPDDWLREALPNSKVMPLAELDASFARTFPHAPPDWTRRWLISHPEVRIEDDAVLSWAGSLLDKSVAVLAHHGSPMTLLELTERVNPNRTRSLINALQHENKHGDRIVWTVNEQWALPEWGIARYMTQHELLVHIVEEHGGRMSQRRLISEAMSRSSWEAQSLKWALKQATSLVVEDGVVRFRQDGEKLRVPDPWTHIDVFRRVDDATLGCWSTVITVNYDDLYKGSGLLPQALAVPLGMDDGEPCTLDCNGTDVSSGFNSSSITLHSSQGWRDTLKALGADDGDQVIFTVLDHHKVAVRLVAPASDTNEDVACIRALIGGSGLDHLLGDVAYAVGATAELGIDPNVEDLEERLNERVLHTSEDARTLNAAMLNLFPELDLN